MYIRKYTCIYMYMYMYSTLTKQDNYVEKKSIRALWRSPFNNYG